MTSMSSASNTLKPDRHVALHILLRVQIEIYRDRKIARVALHTPEIVDDAADSEEDNEKENDEEPENGDPLIDFPDDTAVIFP